MEGIIEKEYNYKEYTFYQVKINNSINLISGNQIESFQEKIDQYKYAKKQKEIQSKIQLNNSIFDLSNPSSQINKGSLENEDIPSKIIKIFKQKEDGIQSIYVEVSWKKRDDGIQPEQSLVLAQNLRPQYAQLLGDYYKQYTLDNF